MVSGRGGVAEGNGSGHGVGSVLAARVGRAGARGVEAPAPAPDLAFLAGGHPDTSVFDGGTLRGLADALVRDGAAALQYGPVDGTEGMREVAAGLMSAEGTPARAVHVSVTCGAQQALDLAGRAFLDAGDLVLVESPAYHGALQAFSAYGPRLLTVPVDRRGLDVEAVREVLTHERRSGARIKFLYTVPTFHNPTGVTTGPGRRRELLRLAHEHGLLIVEDNPYGLLRYEGEAVPTLAATEIRERGGPERVVYLGSVSKVFAPGVRLGWVHAHPDVLAAVRAARKGADLGPSALTQAFATAFFEGSEWRDYLGKLRRGYRRRRDALLGALGEFMPDGASWTEPEGGFFVWVTLPEGIDTAKMLPEAVERGVAYVPGADFYPGGWASAGGKGSLRLSFAFAEPPVARRGVEILAGLLRERTEGTPSGATPGTAEGSGAEPPVCGCGSEACGCTAASCTEELVGVVGC